MHYHALSRYLESDVVLVNGAGQEKVLWSNRTTLRPARQPVDARRVGGAVVGRGDCLRTLGAWPILPLAGLELTTGLRAVLVNWKLEYRHVIRLTDELIRSIRGISCRNAAGVCARESALRVVPRPTTGRAPSYLCTTTLGNPDR